MRRPLTRPQVRVPAAASIRTRMWQPEVVEVGFIAWSAPLNMAIRSARIVHGISFPAIVFNRDNIRLGKEFPVGWVSAAHHLRDLGFEVGALRCPTLRIRSVVR